MISHPTLASTHSRSDATIRPVLVPTPHWRGVRAGTLEATEQNRQKAARDLGPIFVRRASSSSMDCWRLLTAISKEKMCVLTCSS